MKWRTASSVATAITIAITIAMSVRLSPPFGVVMPKHALVPQSSPQMPVSGSIGCRRPWHALQINARNSPSRF